MKLSAADHVRPTPLDAVVVLAVLAAAVLLILAFLPKDSNFLTATVVLNGETVAQFDLTGTEKPHIYAVPDATYPITLVLSHDGAQVDHSDCPSQDCVRTGLVSRAGGQIVCLPNKMVVSVQGKAAPDVDAVVG